MLFIVNCGTYTSFLLNSDQIITLCDRGDMQKMHVKRQFFENTGLQGHSFETKKTKNYREAYVHSIFLNKHIDFLVKVFDVLRKKQPTLYVLMM